LPDDWESANGLDPNNATDASFDFDNDGRSNAAEYAAGTDPRNGTSAFAIGIASLSSGTLHLTFIAQPGRRYRVERTSDLASPTWSVRQIYEPETSVREITFTESPSPLRLFYRVVAEAAAP
jgi:hypothetical protein